LICDAARMDASSCQSTVWTSDSTLRVKVTHGLSNKIAACVSIFSSFAVGSLFGAVTFALPSISVVNPKLLPKSGSAYVSVQMSGLGLTGHTPVVQLRSTNSLSSWWRSDSSVVVKVPSSTATFVTMTLTSSRQYSVLSSAITFDVHQLLSATQSSPSTGAIFMDVTGLDFGNWDFTSSSIRHDRSSGMISVWTSSSSLRCKLSSGAGRGIGIVATVGLAVSFLNNSLSYNVPFVSSGSPLNIASTSSMSITIVGSCFGVASTSARIRISATSSRGESWVSDSSISGKVGYSGLSGHLEPVVVSVVVQSGSLRGLVIFNRPFIKASSGICNVPSSGASSLTILGYAFGEANISPKAALASSQAEAVRWTASSCMSLKISRSVLIHMRDSVVSLDSRFGSVSNLLSFDVPELSSIDAHLVASTGCSSVTVVGRNMGSFSSSMKLVLGASASSTSDWKSDSSMNCKVVRGAGHFLDAMISSAVDRAKSILSMHGSYGSPKVSSLTSNSPKSASVSLTISGAGFASFEVTVKFRFSGTSLEGSMWKSDSCMVVKVASGRYHSSVMASVLRAFSSSTFLFTYNGAALSSSSPTNAPTSGSVIVGVFGKSYAHADYTRSMLSLSTTASESVIWHSDSSIASKVPNGVRNYLTIKVSMNLIGNSISSIFSHDAPTSLNLQPNQIPISGAFYARVFSLGLGYGDYSQKSDIGGSSCAPTNWRSDSSLMCKIIAGSGIHPRAVVVSSSGLVSKLLRTSVSFDAQFLKSYSLPGLVSSGSLSVTVSGDSFGLYGVTPRLKIHLSSVETTFWVSDSSTVLKAVSLRSSHARVE